MENASIEEILAYREKQQEEVSVSAADVIAYRESQKSGVKESINLPSVPNVSSMEGMISPVKGEEVNPQLGPIKSKSIKSFQDTEQSITGHPELDKSVKAFYGDKNFGNYDEIRNAFKQTAQDIKGLVVKDGTPNITELWRGAGQFALAIPGFISGVGLGTYNAVNNLVKQTGEGRGLSIVPAIDEQGEVHSLPIKDFNLEEVVDEFGKGMHEAMQFYQPTIEAITGKPTSSSDVVGRLAMAPFEAIKTMGYELASEPLFSDSPNIRGAIKLVSTLAGLKANGKMLNKNDWIELRDLDELGAKINPLVDEVVNLHKEVKQNISVDITANEANQKIYDLKKAQIEKQIKDTVTKLAKEKYVAEEWGRISEQVAQEKMYPVGDASPEMSKFREKMPSKTEIKKVTAEIPKVDEIPGDVPPNGIIPMSVEDVVNPVNNLDLSNLPDSIISEFPNFKVSDSGLISVNNLKPNEVKALKEAGLIETGILDDGTTHEGVNPELLWKEREKRFEAYRKRDKTVTDEEWNTAVDRRAKIYERMANEEEALGDLADQDVIDKLRLKASEMRSRKRGVEDVVEPKVEPEVIVPPVETPKKTKGKKKPVTPSEPPPPEPITKVDEAVGIEAENIYNERSPFRTDEKNTKIQADSFAEREKSGGIKDPVTAVRKLANDVNRWLDGDESIDITLTRKMLSHFGRDAAGDHPYWRYLNVEDRTFASDVATWAQRTERSKIEQSSTEPIVSSKIEQTVKPKVSSKIKPSGGVRLNSMIPVDQIPEAVKKWFGRPENKGEPIKRNEKLYDLEGYWWNEDAKKWMWEYSNDRAKISKEGLERLFNNEEIMLTELLKDDELYKNVPVFNDTKVVVSKTVDTSMYRHETNTIALNQSALDNINMALEEIIHESSHRINLALGGSKGGSPERFIHRDIVNILERLRNEVSDSNIVSEVDKLFEQLKNANQPNAIFASHTPEYVKKKISNYRQSSEYRKAVDILDTPIDKNEAFREYRKIPGEMQARLDVYRLKMTPEKRRVKYPWDSLEDMLADEGLPLSAGHRLYSDPFFIQAITDTAKKFLKFDKLLGHNKVDLNKLPEGPGKEMIKGSRTFQEAGIKDIKSSERSRSYSLKEFYDLTAEALWNTRTRANRALRNLQKNPKDEKYANALANKLINEAGGHAYGQVMYDQHITKEVFGGLSKHKRDVLNLLIRGKRIEDIANYKPKAVFPKNQEFDKAIQFQYGFGIDNGFSAKEIADLLRRKDIYFEHMKELVDIKLETGTITQEMADGLKSHDYSKFKGIGQRLSDGKGGTIDKLYDTPVPARVGGKLTSINSSGIDSLAHGKGTDILEADQRIVALEMYNRVYGQKFTNDTKVALAELTRNNPNNGIARLGKKETKKYYENAKARGELVERLPDIDKRGHIKHYFWEGGIKKAIYIENNFAEALGASGRDLSPRSVVAWQWLTMAKPFKLMMTGVSPVWSTVINFPIDLFTAFTTSSVITKGKTQRIYSTNPVVYGFQMGRDLAAVAPDVFFRAKNAMKEGNKYIKAAEHGLLMPFMSTQARLSRKGYKLPGTWSKIEDVFSYHSASMELWTRLAIAERVIRRRAAEGKLSMETARKTPEIMEESVARARDYLDFSQGGWFTKQIDQVGAVYLNAGINAVRSTMRALKENPGGTSAALFQGLGVPTVGIVAMALLMKSKTYNEVPDYKHENSMVIPLPDSFRFTDSDGEERGMALSIPIGSTAGFFKNLFLYSTEKALFEMGLSDKEPNYKSIIGSFRQTAPDVISLPPLAKAFTEYGTGINFRTGHEITSDLPGGKKTLDFPDSGEEYTPGKTSKLARDFGQSTGLSPNRSEQFVRDIIAGNEWTGLISYGYDKMFADPELRDLRDEKFAESLAKFPGAKRWFFLTKAGDELKDKQNDIKNAEELSRWVDKKNVDQYAKLYYWNNIEQAKDELDNYIMADGVIGDVNRFKRLREQERFIKSIAELSQRDSWRRMWHESAKVKAKDYIMREKNAKTPEEEDAFRDQFRVVLSSGSYAGEEFWREVGKLRMED